MGNKMFGSSLDKPEDRIKRAAEAASTAIDDLHRLSEILGVQDIEYDNIVVRFNSWMAGIHENMREGE